MIGQTLGAYHVLDRIGQGAMGEVYRARDTALGRDVAIKVLPADFAEDPERMTRFRREAQLLAALNHPNIAHVYGLEGAALFPNYDLAPDGRIAGFLADDSDSASATQVTILLNFFDELRRKAPRRN